MSSGKINSMPVLNSPLGGWPEGSFAGLLPETERTALLAAGSRSTFHDNETLVSQGETGDHLLVVVSGLVKVTFTVADGTKTALTLRSRGDLIGELAVTDHKPRTATATAVGGPVQTIKITGPNWNALLRQYPVILTTYTASLAAKVRASTDNQVAERIWGAAQRVAQVLYSIADKYLTAAPDGSITVPLTQEEIAQLAGVGTSTAEREFSKIRDTGSIASRYAKTVIVNMPMLGDFRFSGQGRLRRGAGNGKVTGPLVSV